MKPITSQPKLCMLFEAIGPYNAIGKIAMAEVEAALNAGWRVSVVAKLLDESLRDRVEWVKLPVPPRGFALQWLTARRCFLHVIGKRLREFDVIHGHQPQIADLCHVFQCHFSTRAAYEHDCLFDQQGLRGWIDKTQKSIVLRAEDWFYGHWNKSTSIVFVSALLRDEFARFYGLPPKEITLENAVPNAPAITKETRRLARKHFFEAVDDRVVLGYLGGTQKRKGYQLLIEAVAQSPNLHLLLGGAGTDNLGGISLDRIHAIGSVNDLDQFYAACDVIVVPSVFDPCPVVVLEAVSRRLPVVATSGVGNLKTLLAYAAGVCWDTTQTLDTVVGQIMENRARFERGASDFANSQSQSNYVNNILKIWENVLKEASEHRQN